jgi:hypothetical protein
MGWIADKEAYLKTREVVDTLPEARTQLSLFDAYEKSKVSKGTSVAHLKSIGAEILAAKYSTQYSSWQFEKPEEIKQRESEIDSKWVLLSELSAEKKKVKYYV